MCIFSSYSLLYFWMYFCWGLGQRECYLPWSAASYHLTGAQSFCGESESAWALTWAGIVALYLVTNEPSGYLCSTAYSHFLQGSCTIALMQWRSHSELCILALDWLSLDELKLIFLCFIYIHPVYSSYMYIQFNFKMVWHGRFYERLARLKKSYWYWIFFRYLLKNSTGTYTPKNEKVRAFTYGANVTISSILFTIFTVTFYASVCLVFICLVTVEFFLILSFGPSHLQQTSCVYDSIGEQLFLASQRFFKLHGVGVSLTITLWTAGLD